MTTAILMLVSIGLDLKIISDMPILLSIKNRILRIVTPWTTWPPPSISQASTSHRRNKCGLQRSILHNCSPIFFSLPEPLRADGGRAAGGQAGERHPVRAVPLRLGQRGGVGAKHGTPMEDQRGRLVKAHKVPLGGTKQCANLPYQ